MGYVPPDGILLASPRMTAADIYLAIRGDMHRPLILEEGMTWQAIGRAPSWALPRGRGLPSTLAEYRAQLYGRPSPDYLPVLNAGLLAAGLALAASVAAVVLR